MRQVKLTRNYGNRDPIVLGAHWYAGAGSINEPTPQPEPTPFELAPIAAEPDPDMQQNDHVITYRTWLGWLETKRNG